MGQAAAVGAAWVAWRQPSLLLLLLATPDRSALHRLAGCIIGQRAGGVLARCASSSQRPPPAQGAPWTKASACHIDCLPLEPIAALAPSQPPPISVILPASRACSSLSSTSKPPKQPWRPRRGSAPAGSRCWLSRRRRRHTAMMQAPPAVLMPINLLCIILLCIIQLLTRTDCQSQRKGDGATKSSKKARGSPQPVAAAPERPPGGKLYFLLKRRVSVCLLH